MTTHATAYPVGQVNSVRRRPPPRVSPTNAQRAWPVSRHSETPNRTTSVRSVNKVMGHMEGVVIERFTVCLTQSSVLGIDRLRVEAVTDISCYPNSSTRHKGLKGSLTVARFVEQALQPSMKHLHIYEVVPNSSALPCSLATVLDTLVSRELVYPISSAVCAIQELPD